MKVVYKRHLLTQIEEAIAAAALKREKIEKIVLTDEEYKLLDCELRSGLSMTPEKGATITCVCGIKIEKED